MLEDPLLRPLVDAVGRTPVESDLPSRPVDAEVLLRQCGRCRAMFEGDPTLYPLARPDWWVCPPCRVALFGRHAGSNGGARPRHTGDGP